jgi:hypothetical protein
MARRVTRRTPALTKQARDIFEGHYMERGTFLYSFDPAYEVTGLSGEQVRDAIWGMSADEWRRELVGRRRAEQGRSW